MKDYTGPGEIETYTVFYNRDGSAKAGVVVAKLPDGKRTLAQVPANDAATIAFLSDGKAEPVGTPGEVIAEGELMVWKRAS